MLLNFFSAIQPTSSAVLNTIIQAIVFEVAMFLSVPLLGIVIEGIVVRGIRRIIAKLITGAGEYVFTSYILFIGVVIHELSHAFFALITGAKITEVALFKPEGGSLGHVSFVARGNAFFQALQNSFSACAPVVVGIIITSLIALRLFPVLNATWQWIVVIYLFVSVLFHMNMSGADLKCYFKGALPLLLLALPVCIILFIFVK